MTKYVATINMPGYLPMDDDPPIFDTAQEAWQYLADERERAEDETVDDGDARPYSLTVAALLDLAESDSSGEGTVNGDTRGYDGDHDLGLAYSVSIVEETP
jgi:hypothetical protein